MTTPKLKRSDLDHYFLPIREASGLERYVDFAFTRDGKMWMEPDEIGAGPECKPMLAQYGPDYILPLYEEETVLLNCLAVGALIDDPFARREWLDFVEDMIQQHQKIITQYDTSRNH